MGTSGALLSIRDAAKGPDLIAVRELYQEYAAAGSLPTMHAAIHLYRRLGFQPIAPYTTNPEEGAVFLELQLDRPDDA